MIKLYYISQGQTPEEHLANIERVCQAGCRQVQLRLKNIDDKVLIDTAKRAKTMCSRYKTLLIINDSVDVAKTVDADGVHLGKNDTYPGLAKEILGPYKIIGGTANTLEDCLELHKQGVDYIGLGPYRFTTTKKLLSPILGLEGYNNILTKLKERNIHIPVFAIGGILETDITPIYETGITGVAASGMLTNTSDEELIKLIQGCSKKELNQ